MPLLVSSTMSCKLLATSKRLLDPSRTHQSSGSARPVGCLPFIALLRYSLTGVSIGWPTAGSTYQSAVPGVDSAQTYWDKAICGALSWGVNVFFFEAFDEPWKPVSTGSDGSVADETHWGAWNSDRTSKYNYTC